MTANHSLPHTTHRNALYQPEERPLTEIEIPEQKDHIYKKYNYEIHVTSTIPFLIRVGPDSSVDIVTRYRLHGPVIESRWGGRDFTHQSRPLLGTT
jgi:hypothetical protein